MRHLGLLALLLAACGTSSDGTPDDTDVVETDGGDTAAPTDTDCSDDIPEEGALLQVTIEDAAGHPLGRDKVQVRYCRGVACATGCVQGNVQTIGGLADGVGSLEIAPSGDGVGALSTPFAPFTVQADQTSALHVTVPAAGTPVALPKNRAEIQLLPGLWITAGQGDLVGATGLDPDPTEIAAVDATDVKLPIQGVTGEVLAVYYLDPFDAPTADGVHLDVRLDNATWNLGDGEGELYVGDYGTSAWVKVGDLATQGPDKLVVSGLTRISTLLVVRKTP